MKKRVKSLYFNESIWEDYVVEHPEAFLNENLNLYKRQWKLPSGGGRPDLVFERRNGELLIVELQLKALDRNHFYKTFEYQREIETITGKSTKIKILCNSLNERKNYVEMHSQNLGIDIDVIVIPEKEVKRRILELHPEVVFLSSKSGKASRDTREEPNRILETYLKDKVNELEDALIEQKLARLPDKIRQLVSRKKEYNNEFLWAKDLFQIVETMAKPYQHESMDGYDMRAFCPLCYRGAENIYEGEMAWMMPEGLERHILHTHNVRKCKISGIAKELVQPYFNEKSDREYKEKLEEKEQRRLIEDTYLTNPNESPKLLDERIFPFESCRSNEQLKTAEKRLKELNFIKNQVGGVIKYTRQIDDHTVFADPRFDGRIYFLLFKHKTLKKGIAYRLVGLPSKDFFILDKWKNIDSAFNKRIANLIEPKQK